MSLELFEVASNNEDFSSPIRYPLEERYTSSPANPAPIRASSRAYPGCPTIAAPRPTMKAVAEPAIIGRSTAISMREPNRDIGSAPSFLQYFLLCKDSITRRKGNQLICRRTPFGSAFGGVIDRNGRVLR